MTAETTTTQRMRVKEGRCQGHGRCYSIGPELFEPDDEGFSIALPVDLGEDVIDVAYRVVGECPEQAVEIVAADDVGKESDR